MLGALWLRNKGGWEIYNNKHKQKSPICTKYSLSISNNAHVDCYPLDLEILIYINRVMRILQTKQQFIRTEIFPLYSHAKLLKYAPPLPPSPSVPLRSVSVFIAPFMCLCHFVCHCLALARLLPDSIQSNSGSFISQFPVPDKVNRIITLKEKKAYRFENRGTCVVGGMKEPTHYKSLWQN